MFSQYLRSDAGRLGYSLILYYSKDPEGFEREYSASVVPDVASAKPKKAKKAAGDDDEEEVEEDDQFTTVGKGGKSMLFSAESIFKNLQLIQEARGKKVGELHQ